MDLNEELKKLTVDGLTELGTWVHGAKSFAIEQAPEIAKEFVSWHIASNAINAITCLILLVVFYLVSTKVADFFWVRHEKSTDKRYSDNDSAALVCRVVGAIICLGSFVSAMGFFKEVSKGVFAPRIVIMEGIADIVAKTK